MTGRDDRLAALFRDAAGAAPEAGFDHGDVTRASRRITVRRRAALSGVAAVLVVLGGTGVVVAATRDSGTTATAASAPEAAPLIAGSAGGADRAAPPVPGAPLGPGTTECADRQDPALRELLDQALPQVAGATSAASSDICLPGKERYVTVEATDGALQGVFGVSYLPPGVAVSLAPGAVSAPAASGGTVIVGSTAIGPGPAPFADRVRSVLEFLAPRL